MRSVRQCSRTACGRPAVATLTYVYADSTAVLGPLAQHAEPHSYDLCVPHAERLTAPRGWEGGRLLPDFEPLAPSRDDLLARADAGREAGRSAEPDDIAATIAFLLSRDAAHVTGQTIHVDGGLLLP